MLFVLCLFSEMFFHFLVCFPVAFSFSTFLYICNCLSVRNVNDRNGTVNWLLENLVDYGFYWIGVGDVCREHAVCLSAGDFAKQVHGLVNKDNLVSVPPEILGNHDLTYAWLIGMQSTSPETCHQLYECNSNPSQ